MTHQKKLLCFLLTFAIIALPVVSSAQGDALGKLKDIGGKAYGVGATTQSPAQIVGNLIKIALSVVGLIFLILMIYGGYLWMTARGKEERVTKAKETLEAAVIGIIIVLAAYAITYFVISRIITSTIAGTPTE